MSHFFGPKGQSNICLTCIAYIGAKLAERSDCKFRDNSNVRSKQLFGASYLLIHFIALPISSIIILILLFSIPKLSPVWVYDGMNLIPLFMYSSFLILYVDPFG